MHENRKETYGKFDDLLDTIKIEIEAGEVSEGSQRGKSGREVSEGSQRGKSAREVSEGVRSTPQQSGKRPGGQSTVGAFVTKGGNSGKFQIRCVYCEELHYSASCEKVVSSEDRKTILRQSICSNNSNSKTEQKQMQDKNASETNKDGETRTLTRVC